MEQSERIEQELLPLVIQINPFEGYLDERLFDSLAMFSVV
jgi:hypothetical protein